MRYLISLFLVLLVSITHAMDQPIYQVELIIFSSMTPEGLQAEQWPPVQPFTLPTTPYTTLLTHSSAIQDTPTSENTDNDILLPTTQFQLTKAAKRLQKNPQYHILLHEAWQESVPNKETAKPIYISNQDSDDPIKVNGMMTLYLDRYFNTYFNLTFSVPTSITSSMTQEDHFNNILDGQMRFTLLQSRRMRSKELNYIDHPLFGILLEIIPKTTDKNA